MGKERSLLQREGTPAGPQEEAAEPVSPPYPGHTQQGGWTAKQNQEREENKSLTEGIWAVKGNTRQEGEADVANGN